MADAQIFGLICLLYFVVAVCVATYFDYNDQPNRVILSKSIWWPIWLLSYITTSFIEMIGSIVWNIIRSIEKVFTGEAK